MLDKLTREWIENAQPGPEPTRAEAKEFLKLNGIDVLHGVFGGSYEAALKGEAT